MLNTLGNLGGGRSGGGKKTKTKLHKQTSKTIWTTNLEPEKSLHAPGHQIKIYRNPEGHSVTQIQQETYKQKQRSKQRSFI